MPIPSTISQLPINAILTEVCENFHYGRDLIICATPGAGKSTGVPLALLDKCAGKLLLVQPRRVAAVGVARRMATLLEEPCPDTIGYRTRPETRVSANTRLEVVTEGILLRMLQSDPALTEYDGVLLDECHERSCNMDLALALLGDTRGALRDDLRIVLMSATLDTETFAKALPGAKSLSCEARQHPIETVYQAPAAWQATPLELCTAISTALHESTGDVLVFLPGRGEIQRLADALAQHPAGEQADVVQLHGSLAVEAQDRITHPNRQSGRRIILSTAIAETSLTIDGVTAVVDAGLSRREVFDIATGMNRLTTTRASEASANQRRGRAGRTAPGFCVRMWSAHERREKHTTPEISKTGLAALCLELALWGTPDPAALQWLTEPPAAAVSQAQALLQRLGLLDEHGRITQRGRDAGKIGTDPRLATMLLQATEPMREQACLLAAILSEGSIRAGQGDDLEQLIRQHHPNVVNKRVRQSARQFAARLPSQFGKADTLPALLGAAYPERIALQRKSGALDYLLSQGSAARLSEHSTLHGQPALVIADLTVRRDGAVVRSAVPLSRSALFDDFAHLIEEHNELVFDDASARFVQRRQQRLGALILQERLTAAPDGADLSPALLDIVVRKQQQVLNWTEDCDRLCQRTTFLNAVDDTSEIPLLDKTKLLSQPQDWLEPFLAGVQSVKALARVDVLAALSAYLGWQTIPELDHFAPDSVCLPSGKRVRIDYTRAQHPAIKARIQELFSLTEHPCIGPRQTPLQIHLLSPAQRPVQITADIAGFWRGSYAEVKKEMKGRYPKHHWPDDPASTSPHSTVRPR